VANIYKLTNFLILQGRVKMGRKLKEASFRGKDIKIDEASEDMRGELFCPKCGIELTYVNGYKKEINDKICYVPPYFRLKKKDKDDDHKPGCKYNTVGQLKIFAKESNDNILEDLGNDKFNFRLHLISESIREISKTIENKDEADNKDDKSKPKEKEYKAKEEKLESYLSTMRRLVELRSFLEENSDISSKVKLDFRDKNGDNHRVTWNHFYYEIDSFYDLYKYIDEKKPQHPICIFGKIRNINPPKEGYEFYTIEMEIPKWEKVGEKFEAASISIKVKNKKLNEMIKDSKDKYILLYGNFWNGGKRYWEKGKCWYLNIRGELLHKNQFIISNEEDI
jgi:hypothetical protein